MVRLIEKFDGPVRAIKTLLGDSYEKEYSALSSLCGLIQTYRPRKIIKVGGRNSSATAAVLCCVERLQLPCQLAVVDSYDAVPGVETAQYRDVPYFPETCACIIYGRNGRRCGLADFGCGGNCAL